MNVNSLEFNLISGSFISINGWFPVSTQPHWRIYWNPTPGAKIVCGEKCFYPDSNSIIAIPPGISVEQTMESPFDHFYLHVAIGFPYSSYPEIVHFSIGEESKNFLSKIVEECKEIPIISDWPEHRRNMINRLVYRVITELDEDKLQSQHLSPTIRKTVNALNRSIVAGVSNKELAEQAGMSLRAFLAKFNRETSTTPQQYLLQKRLEKAAHLLSSTEQSIERVAESCGFCERSYLSRLFKREYGSSPAAFRKNSM